MKKFFRQLPLLPLFALLLTAWVSEASSNSDTPTRNTLNTNASRSSVTTCFGSIHQPLVIVEACERALTELRADPTGAELAAVVQSALALQYARKGQLPTSRVLMEEAAARSPQNLDVLVNLGSLNVYEGNFDAALMAYDRALAMQPDPHIYLNRSLALRALGRYAEAQNDYDSYVALMQQRMQPSNLEVELQDSPVTTPIDGVNRSTRLPLTKDQIGPRSGPQTKISGSAFKRRADSIPVEDRAQP